jgi:aryl-alcohol dehydrogenase-like predicted oxidoreductase
VVHREDDAFLEELAAQKIAYVPFFPLGGFTPLQSSLLDSTAASLQATPMQIALAWLLQRSPNILLIPGTASLQHLHENLKAADLKLPPEVVEQLNSIASANADSTFPTR